MGYNLNYALEGKVALADFFVPVLVCAEDIFRVIQMDCLKLIKADNFVKLLKNSVWVIGNIVSAVMDMAGIKANANAVLVLDPVDYFLDFLKGFADLGAHARHCFNEHHCLFTFCKNSV